jgi:predicted MFS family arabinose efflux permease
MHIDLAHALSPVRRTATKTVRAAANRTGSRARLRAVVTLAAVIALDGADKGTVSATASDLKQAFNVGNTDIGVLLTVVSLVSAVLTVPMGVLTDRISRTRLLAVTIVGWAVAVAISGTATSFMFLLWTRIGLAAVTAAAGPAVASLVGDLFPTDERGKIYGRILAGELVGTGLGLVGSTFVAGMFGWRWAFWWLVLPTLGVAWVLFRTREPGRDQTDVLEAEPDSAWRSDDEEKESRGAMRRALQRANVHPREELVLRGPPYGTSPDRMSLWRAVIYVLRVPTNRILIVASALGYFFFAGLRGFAVEFSQDQYGVSKSQASGLMLVIGAGALVGVFVGGRLADRLLGRGVVAGRVWVPVIALISVPVFVGPALWATEVAIALPLIVAGAAVLSAANPPQDAARLDIMHPRLWGRSESIRSLARTALESTAPLLFGFTSEHLFGGDGAGLQATFLIFLVALPAAGGIGMLAVRSYPRDVATAQASIENLGDDSADEPTQAAS